MFTDDRAPWAQQPGEGPKAFAAFGRYRDLPPNQRSLDAAWRAAHPAQPPAKRRSKTWAEWSRQFGWVDRAAAWDREIDQQKRDRFLKAQLDAVERHQRAAQALLTLSTLPARTLLQRMQNPAFQAELDKLSGLALMRETWRAAAIVPAIANMERLALGLTTNAIEFGERERRADDAVVAAIGEGGAALDHAIELLNIAAARDRATAAPPVANPPAASSPLSPAVPDVQSPTAPAPVPGPFDDDED